MIIESFGVYLPERLVTTADMLKPCRHVPVSAFQRLTGIERRPVVSPSEYSIDLARQAVQRCLAASRRPPQTIDLIICCNISRCDGPDHRMSIEPTTAARLRAEFCLSSADAFDVSNACAGTFTALLLAQVAFATRAAHRALIVSGEHITHLATTAQQEIESLNDPRLACLTLGDSGVAILVEAEAEPGVGFHDIDLFTLGQYSGLCTGALTDRPHGGAIMYTRSRQLTEAALAHCVPHGPATMTRHEWAPDRVDAFITHQTAKFALEKARAALNCHLRRTWLRADNFVCNIRDRGNLATNSHFVALHDWLRQGRLRKGQRVVFSIAASGLTGGTALYTLDDLPDRLQQTKNGCHGKITSSHGPAEPSLWSPRIGVRLSRVSTVRATALDASTGVDLATDAAGDCLARAGYAAAAIDLLIYCGVYRDKLLSEPAVAAMLAGRLGVEAADGPNDYSKLAFDISDGAIGFLKALQCGAQMIDAGRARRVLVVTSERHGDPTVRLFGANAIATAASAALLERQEESSSGFQCFAFQSFKEPQPSRTSYCEQTNGSPHVVVAQTPDFVRAAEENIAETIRTLAAHAAPRGGIQWLILLGSRGEYLATLCEEICLPPQRVVVPPTTDGDLFTSSFAFAWTEFEQISNRQSGQQIVVVQVGSGMRVGSALYRL